MSYMVLVKNRGLAFHSLKFRWNDIKWSKDLYIRSFAVLAPLIVLSEGKVFVISVTFDSRQWLSHRYVDIAQIRSSGESVHRSKSCRVQCRLISSKFVRDGSSGHDRATRREALASLAIDRTVNLTLPLIWLTLTSSLRNQ